MFFTNDLGIDLGTMNTLVYVKGKGIVVSEPSVVAIRKETGKILAIGTEAKKMLGKTSDKIDVIQPIRDGVIADFDIASVMLRFYINKALEGKNKVFSKSRVVMCISSGLTSVEEKAIKEVVLQAGVRDVYLIEAPMAAAFGVGLPVHEPSGSMIVDIGGGTTEIAIISLGGIVASKCIRVAGEEMDESIVQFIKKKHNLLIGNQSAESLKIKIGAASFNAHEAGREAFAFATVHGRDLVTGLPKIIKISAEEIRQALNEQVMIILSAIKACLEKAPPELAADIIDKGILMAGGGSQLWGLDFLISDATGMPVYIVEDPICAGVNGAGKVLENIEIFKRILVSAKTS